MLLNSMLKPKVDMKIKKKLTKKQLTPDKYGFSNHDYDIINNKILEFFDGGEFKYDETVSCQSEAHRNHKRSCKKFIQANITMNGHKYFRSILRATLHCGDNQQEVDELNDEIKRLNVENDELKKFKYNCEQFHSKENITALANSLVLEMNEKFKNDYVCNNEDVKELNKTIKRKTEDVNFYKEKVSELEKEVEYQREKVKDSIVESSENANNIANTLVGVETQSLRSTIKELKDEIKQLKNKDNNNIGDDKEKKYKKIILELKKRIIELEVDAM